MNRSLLISIVLAVLAFVWILSGALTTNDESQAAVQVEQSEEQKKQALFKVRVKNIAAVAMIDQIQLQGEISAARDIEIKAETEGPIRQLHAQKGDRLSKGQAIVTIAMNDRQARLEQAQAELKVREVDLDSGATLKQKNLLSQNQHEQNVANVVAAKAAVKQIQVEISQTRIKAAFDGILNRLDVEEGDYVSTGDTIAALVDDSEITISASVPQQHIAKISLGQQVEAILLDGTVVNGEISFISSTADEGTRTFRIEAKASNTEAVSRFGQSARINVLVGELLAHKVSPSHLDLNQRGDLRVKGVDAQQQVVVKPVTIIRNENDGVWVEGIPASFNLITVGQGFVSQGDQVEAIDDITAEPFTIKASSIDTSTIETSTIETSTTEATL